MKRSYDAIIVGGGVNGAAIAFNLTKRGMKVLLLEKNRLASKSSGAAAGMLGAQAELENNGPLFQLARRSRAMFVHLAEELKEISGIDIELVNKGMYKIAFSEDQEHEYKRIIQIHRQAGEIAEWLDGDVLRKDEPTLSEEIRGGMYIPNDGHVSPYRLTAAFAYSALKLGAEIKEFTEVFSINDKANQIQGVITNEGGFFAENVIIAGGAWSGKIVSELGVGFDILPVKGECFSVKSHRTLLEKTIFSHGCYLVPKSQGRIIVGATMKENTFDETVSLDGISILLERAKKIIPSIVDAEWEKAWAGIRPQTGDGLPFLGEHSGYKGLFIAAGHFRNGILLSPVTGELVAELVIGNVVPELQAFGLNRLPK
ncbi:glycine oxidase ThiO [Fredinandcohnia quinoae]|uniref:Aerobic glycerol-3-phosphate dehydrogenase n=1 Tax=Fredinandcohnia quinoae TaxID=2918902 RepID=A0AAW5E2F1_9BACI|nr:glycine oxidase ThiO [Fredinandcohnia sp. SECRCQ15]MCH1627076.1 glycine oxidase ThiO [Fredinandcohnia sp. SECRCQ15]